MVKGKFILPLGLAGALAVHGIQGTPYTETTMAALGPLTPTAIVMTLTTSAVLMVPWIK
jgi:hypothetical protein